MSNDQYASYNQRINAICNELSIIGNRVSSLEERTEPSISDDKPITPQFKDYKQGQAIKPEDLEAYKAYRESFTIPTACDDTCIGDRLGQCSTDCDGSIAQCGRPANLCRSCSPAMHEAMSMPACKQGERACKYESDHSGGDAWSEDWSECAKAKGLSISDMRLLRSIFWAKYLYHPSVDCIYKLTDSEVSSLLSVGYIKDYSDKPRRARVDNDDAKYGVADLKGLGGSTERRVGEHKANMAAVWLDGVKFTGLAATGLVRSWWAGLTNEQKVEHAADVCKHGWSAIVDTATLMRSSSVNPMLSGSVAPVQAVYCCNGAMYEARQ